MFKSIDFSQFENSPILWVQALPGAGKTHAVKQYLATRKHPSLWLSLKEIDNKLSNFLHQLNLLTDSQFIDSTTLQSGHTIDQPTLKRLAKHTLDFLEQQGPDLFLVVDDFEKLNADGELTSLFNIIFNTPNFSSKTILISSLPLPSYMATLIANSQLTRYPPKNFLLDKSQSSKYLTTISVHSDKHEWFWQQTHGWITGIKLLSESMLTHDFNCQNTKLIDYSTCHSYFKQKIFPLLSANLRQGFIASCLFDEFNKQELTYLCTTSVQQQIEQLLSSDCFLNETRVDSNGVIWYRYFDIFKQSLQQMYNTQLSEQKRFEITRITAKLYYERGDHVRALQCSIQFGEWEKSQLLVNSLAHNLAIEGKYLELKSLLQSIPIRDLKDSTSCQYWLGVCTLPFNPVEAAIAFKRAMTNSNNTIDHKITYQLAMHEENLSCYSEYRPEIDYENLFHDNKKLQTLSSFNKLLLLTNAHCYVLYACPEINKLEKLNSLIQSALEGPKNIIRQNVGCSNVNITSTFTDFLWRGRYKQANDQLTQLGTLLNHHSNPYLRVVWCLINAELLLRTNKQGLALDYINKGIALAGHHKFGLSEAQLTRIGMECCLSTNQLTDANNFKKTLEKMKPLQTQSMLGSIFNMLLDGELKYKNSEFILAQKLFLTAHQYAEQNGVLYYTTVASIYLIDSLINLNKLDQAEKLLTRGIKLANTMQSFSLMHRLHISRTLLHLARAEAANAKDSLKITLAIGAKYQYYTHLFWKPKEMETLLTLASSLGIEKNYVTTLVEQHSFTFDIIVDDSIEQEYKVKIQTLGLCKIMLENKTIKVGRKIKKKQYELLYFLIASSTEWVDQCLIQDALWPDSEGDAAAQALYTTLHRLRKLLGTKDAIDRIDGKLRINRLVVNIDIGKLITNLHSLVKLIESNAPLSDIKIAVNNCFILYQGEFLPAEDNIALIRAKRELLQTRFIQTLEKTVKYLKSSSQREYALTLVTHAFEIHPTSFKLLDMRIDLMVVRGFKAEAVKLFKQNQTLLSAKQISRISRKLQNSVSIID
ncbi:hypothetical protein MNBD_GAMMA12-3962 [hydrothermal vent metagenome]|uniref:Bacterial transcriptional activator domain-containing protein n=1 Tax=hydrothermal vent metagenome TaxID=652676 RepID=A0A3B0YK66_9ZZZZ